mmetsp:Transcript_10427/g.18173  ORF Transcript_10427/g.18173 Transcript_10427/m.18173 type:complete len:80 (-) Transcript_10427:375-614(-)
MSADRISPLGTPVPQELYPLLATVLLSGGALFTGSFFLYEVSKTKHSRQLKTELILALIASVLLGLGTLFLLLWTGVYV